MHKLAEKMAECLKAKVEGMGIDNIEGENLVELGMWVDILKDLACYDKDMRIIKAMDEEEESGEWDEEDDGRRGYRGQPRDSRGRYMSRRGRRSRRGYDEPMEDMMGDMHMYPAEYYRDMDRESMGRMYYTGGGSGGSSVGSLGGVSGSSSGGSGMSGSSGGMSGGSSSGTSGGSSGGTRGYSEGGNYGRSEGRDSREGRSGQSRRGYMEAKETKGNTPEEKKEKMKELEKYMSELNTDIIEMIGDASPEEKSMLKGKLQTLATKIS